MKIVEYKKPYDVDKKICDIISDDIKPEDFLGKCLFPKIIYN